MNRKQFRDMRVAVFAMLLFVYTTTVVQAQTKDAKALAMLDKAFGDALLSGNVALYFEGLAFGQQDPKKIFTLPVYQVLRGGYAFVDGKKMEMQLGTMKSLCDGKLFVMINEKVKMMYVDSVRASALAEMERQGGEKPDFIKSLTDIAGAGDVVFIGDEQVNGRLCHHLKASFSKGSHVQYWIDAKTEKLYLVAEWQEKAYNVYWINRIEQAPKKHDYSIHLPAKQLNTYYGYEVLDNRFLYKKF